MRPILAVRGSLRDTILILGLDIPMPFMIELEFLLPSVFCLGLLLWGCFWLKVAAYVATRLWRNYWHQIQREEDEDEEEED